MEHADQTDKALVTLALRGERIPLCNAVSSVYNPSRRELLVANASTLYLYGKMLTAGGALLGVLAAEKNVHFQFVLQIPWLDAYSVIAADANGKIEHRIVSTDLRASLTSHSLIEKGGQFFTALSNPHRRELITADSDGGLKVWTLRVVATAQNNGGLKGILRLHTAATSARKPFYHHLRMSFDGKLIFAATSTRVYVFDAASCNRLSCCLHEDQLTISSLECGGGDNSIYLMFKERPREICKYSFKLKKKGQPHFQKTGECDHYEDCVVFHEKNQWPPGPSGDRHTPVNDSNEARGVFLVDACARFTIADCSVSTAHAQEEDNDSRLGGDGEPVVTLPFNPLSEQYHALHTDMSNGERNLVFVVWSTGFCILEIFFPNSQGRRVCTTFDGEHLKRLSVEKGDVTSIYQRLPSPRVVLFEESYAALRVTPVQSPVSSDAFEETEVALCMVDYFVEAQAMVALWSNGVAERYALSDNRVVAISQPLDRSCKASALAVVHFQAQCYAAIGDSTGTTRLFPVFPHSNVSNTLRIQHETHADSVSALFDLSKNEVVTAACMSLLSIARSGEVKKWAIKGPATPSSSSQAIAWELLVCFRTYSPDLSTAMFEFPDFVFCGFDGGGVECWRLPSTVETQTSKFQQHSHRIAVVKRALHSIDLHLTPVLKILCEWGAGTVVTASPQPVADEFSWVFSYDKDAILLIWCFSVDFFFPHRRIKVHDFIRGLYVAPTSGTLDVFAYIDRCIERLDQLGPKDKDAVRERLQLGRIRSAQHALQVQGGHRSLVTDTGGGSEGGSDELSQYSYSPDFQHLNQASVLVPGAPSVHISITLPAVEKQTNTAVIASSAATAPINAVTDSTASAPIEEHGEEKDTNPATCKVETSPAPSSSPPKRRKNSLRGEIDGKFPKTQRSPPSSPSTHRKMPRRKKPQLRKAATDAKSGFLPGKNSLPSAFRQEEPRVYRKVVNPLDSLPTQARCAVVTAGDPDVSSSSSEEDMELTQVDTTPIPQSRGVGRSAIPQKGLQDKVSVVSLADYEDESILVLDFKPGTRRPRLRGSPKLFNDGGPERMDAPIEIPFVPWEGLSERERKVELMAASKSRCVQEDAESDRIRVPPVQDFESLEIPVQLGVRSFTRWFAATQRHHQRIRERFLLEELRFAAMDSVVHHRLAEAGLTPPSLEQIGSSGSTAWQEFAAWYSLGRVSTPSIGSDAHTLQTERLKARTEYLELRLRLVAQAELEVQREEEAAGPCEEECEPPQRVFIFEHFVKISLSDKENASSWENTSLDNRQQEITLALLDPVVQVAAMKNEIELPDVSSASLEDCDFFELAGKFMPWWKAARNSHRRDFLAREVQEASKNKAILELLAQEQLAAGDGELHDGQVASKTFLEAYFRSDTARHTFLKKKLFYLKRKSRIASVARYGKLPAPLVLETLPLPLSISFRFVEKLAIEEVETVSIAIVEDEKAAELEELRVKEAASAEFDNQDDTDEQERRRIEHENARRILELINMAQEDAISREYNRSSEESDDEVEEQVLAVPKRTDFSRSYFFGNLPIHFRTLVSYGWQAGSGIDNGDEEQEEEEQLERERERQRLLDEQEAERILELERQAERARIEKERDERAFQFRRVRQADLKKVLVRQAELETQRKLDLESVHLGLERDQMLREDESARWHRDQLLRDQDGMLLEDQLASSVRRELREAATARMRLLLNEHACMTDEDQRSTLVGDALREQEHLQASRRAYLSELYTPFSPFFQSSSVGSEDFLPRIQRRLALEQQRRTPVAAGGRYTIPVADALLLDEVDQDAYLARDSRKFNLLMGLPLRTPSSQKRPRIPTEAAIILMQQQRHGIDVEERQETPSKDHKATPLPRKVAQHSHVRARDSRSECLPAIVLRNASPSTLTDLKEACRMQTTVIPALHKASSSNQQQQQNPPTPALPFFRGNMVVQGHSQARAKDYSC